MGGFLGIGGSSAKTDRGRSLWGWDKEQNFFNKVMGLADTLTDKSTATDEYGRDILKTGLDYAKTGFRGTQTGMDTLGGAKRYFQTIMSGSRPDMMAAIAPEVNAVNETADASRTGGATFGTQRGGGVNAAAQSAETQRMTDITNAIFGARPGAAGQVAKIGGEEADIGASQAGIGLGVGRLGTEEQDLGIKQLESGLRALGLSQSAIQHIIDSSIKSRKDSYAINKDTRNDILKFASALFGALGGIGGGGDGGGGEIPIGGT